MRSVTYCETWVALSYFWCIGRRAGELAQRNISRQGQQREVREPTIPRTPKQVVWSLSDIYGDVQDEVWSACGRTIRRTRTW